MCTSADYMLQQNNEIKFFVSSVRNNHTARTSESKSYESVTRNNDAILNFITLSAVNRHNQILTDSYASIIFRGNSLRICSS